MADNWETHQVSLYIDNESNEAIHEARMASLEDTDSTALREWFGRTFMWDHHKDELMGRGTIVADLISNFESEVDWQAVRDSYYEEAKENGLVEEEEEGEGSWDDDPELRKALGMVDA